MNHIIKRIITVIILFTTQSAYSYSDYLMDGIYFPAGINAGLSSYSGPQFGFEGSIVSVSTFIGTSEKSCFGLYCDYIFSAGCRRISAGPEFGILPVIIDGGYLRSIEDDRIREGFTVRATIVNIVLPYIRYGRLSDSVEKDSFIEAGIMLKFPVPLTGM